MTNIITKRIAPGNYTVSDGINEVWVDRHTTDTDGWTYWICRHNESGEYGEMRETKREAKAEAIDLLRILREREA